MKDAVVGSNISSSSEYTKGIILYMRIVINTLSRIEIIGKGRGPHERINFGLRKWEIFGPLAYHVYHIDNMYQNSLV